MIKRISILILIYLGSSIFSLAQSAEEIKTMLAEYENKCKSKMHAAITNKSSNQKKKTDIAELNRLVFDEYPKIDAKIRANSITPSKYWNYQINIIEFIEREFPQGPEVWAIPKPEIFNAKNVNDKELLIQLVRWQLLNRLYYAVLNYDIEPMEATGAFNYFMRELTRLELNEAELEEYIQRRTTQAPQ